MLFSVSEIRYAILKTLLMVLACWRKFFEGDGATLVGFTSSEGYTFERSRALRGNQWCGLVIDLDNQSEQAKKKIKEWCEQVKKEFA